MPSETATSPSTSCSNYSTIAVSSNGDASHRSTPRSRAKSHFDPHGPLNKEWRDGDSVWSLVAEDRLDRALSRIRKLDKRGELETYVARNDAPRTHIGQVTILYASRR